MSIDMYFVFPVLLFISCSVGSVWNFTDLRADQRPLCPCGSNSSSVHSRVVGGHNAGKGRFPYASCLLDVSWQRPMPFCGATLITDSHVVTAAHCIQNKSPEAIYLDIGDYDLNNDTQRPRIRQVKSIVAFPKYRSGSFHYDIAIIEFEQPIKWKSGLKAAWLPPPDLQVIAGTVVSVYGWGRLKYDGGHPRVLQSVDLPVIENHDCQSKFRTRIQPNMLCAGGQKGHDACTGDSGSGLVVRLDNEFVLCGLVSFGRHCALPHIPGVYTRVSSYTEWIYEKTLSSKCKPCIYDAQVDLPTSINSSDANKKLNSTAE